MSILAKLVTAYGRFDDSPPPGYSMEKISFVVSLGPDGAPDGPPLDLRKLDGKKPQPVLKPVPAAFKRPGVTPRAFFLWDNTAYALGVSAAEGKDPAPRLAAFRQRHLDDLAGVEDEGLLAMRRFVESWQPERFVELGWPEEMKDANIVFRLGQATEFIHQRPAAMAMLARPDGDATADDGAICLVTGVRGPVARLHPPIKGVDNAQSMGASLVSFNLEAFTSYGHEQGDNAPVSVAAAEAYVGALNRFLQRGSRHRLNIGDATTVFWAEAGDAETAALAEDSVAAMMGGEPVDAEVQSEAVRTVLEKIRAGRAEEIPQVAPGLAEGVRFYVLGLAPNNSRLSVRYWLESDFGELAHNLSEHARALTVEPPYHKERYPPLWRYLLEVASQHKRENVPPQLAGDWMRCILTGSPYPLTLQNTVLMRLRADKEVNALRVALLKGCLVTRETGGNVPVALDLENEDPGYLLGRLFAVYEYAQTQALPGVNATIRDKFYGTASATPRAVFPTLQRGATHHLAKLRKEQKGTAVFIDRTLAEIFDRAKPEDMTLPMLTPTRQALFAIGYYHQKNEFYRKRPSNDGAANIEDAAE